MLIAQVSDLHLHADPAHPNRARLARVLEHLAGLQPVPDLLVLSGDLADDGEVESYRLLQAALRRWTRPVHLALGNHDNREAFLSVFGPAHAQAGFVQGRVDLGEPGGLHLLVLDTTEPGRHGGAFCDTRAQWLRTELGKVGNAPVLVFMHHPPCDIGISWIDPGPGQAWTGRLDAALGGARVAALCTGHVHVSAVVQWKGRLVATCPSSSSDLSLTFGPMAGGQPDGRPLVEQGEPAFAMHRWEGGALTTLFGRCPQRVLARWDAAIQPVVEGMLAERGFGSPDMC